MDLVDKELLAAMESGFSPSSRDQQRRIDFMVADGLCYRDTREGAGNVYRLSVAGEALLLSLRGKPAKGV